MGFEARAACATALLAIGFIPALAQTPKPLEQAIRSHIAKQGPVSEQPKPIMADLDADKSDEAVVAYCIDDNLPGGANEGATNPANVHCELAVFALKNGKWVLLGKAELGQGDVKEVKAGVIHAESVTYGPKDPLCCPSRKRPIRFGLKAGKLVTLR
jgi:hypothetical protein